MHRPAARPATYSGELPSLFRLAVARLSFTHRARDLGFSIEQVRALLDLADQRDRPCETVDAIARCIAVHVRLPCAGAILQMFLMPQSV
jgi:hypothetical protein